MPLIRAKFELTRRSFVSSRRQTVLEQTFEEVHAMKTAVFDCWEVSNFKEVSFLSLLSRKGERTKR